MLCLRAGGAMVHPGSMLKEAQLSTLLEASKRRSFISVQVDGSKTVNVVGRAVT